MMEVYANLYVGDENDCFYKDKQEWAAVHACKSPCHQKAVGYRGNLPKNHPNYLILEKENHLYLNMVDMSMPLSHEFTGPIILTALDFINKHIESKKILIHCNLGYSRSPAIALLFMAKRKKSITNESYTKAKEDFKMKYPNYNPGRGIEIYLTNYWIELK